MAVPIFEDFLYPFLLQICDKDVNVGVSTKHVYEVKRIDSDYLEE